MTALVLAVAGVSKADIAAYGGAAVYLHTHGMDAPGLTALRDRMISPFSDPVKAE